MSDPVDRTSVTVRIAGEEHAIRSNADPDYTKRCARFVDDRILELRRRSGLMEGHKAAILAALSITDQFFQARDDLERLSTEVAATSLSLVKRIEEGLAEGGGD